MFRCSKLQLKYSATILCLTSALLCVLRAAPPNDSDRGAKAPPTFTGVRLILGSEEVSPTTTFELRFDQAMVPPEAVGLVAEPSPLAITPALPGKFTWLSQRSGVFVPTEPLALGTNYQLRLAANLKNAEGKPADAKLMTEVKTPPMSVTDTSPAGFRENDAPSSPKIIAQFNVRLNPQDLAPYIIFQDVGGHVIPALVSSAKAEDGYFEGPENEQKAWRDRFQRTPNDSARPSSPGEKLVIPNRIVIRSAQPLTPAEGWRCLLKKGLPAADGPEKLPEEYEIKIGKVLPFAVENVEAHNTIDDGKWLRIEFTKSLSPILKPEELRQWISVVPEPANVRFDLNDSSIAIHGDFKLEEQYHVTVKQGLAAEEPFTLTQSFSKDASFTPIPPRLYFPALSTTQLSGGRRVFELQTVNLPSVSLRGRLLDKNSVIFALAGYKAGYPNKGSSDDNGREPYRGIPFELVPGKTIVEQTIDTSSDRDVVRTTPLSGDEMLKGRRSGTVFLSAEGSIGESGDAAKAVGAQAIVQLTDLGLAWKFNNADAWVYVFSQETGLPVGNATIRLLTNENETVLTTKTSAAGIAYFHRDPRGQWLMAERGDDFQVIEFGAHPPTNVPLYAFNLPFGYSEPRHQQPVFLFSDRPLYQPGESVHLKGIVRAANETGLALPQKQSFTLRLTNPDDEKIWEQPVTLSPTGTFSAEAVLPNGRLGDYTAIADFGNSNTRSLSFLVQEYKPAPFEISLKTKDSYAADESVRANVSANYFHGKPLGKARVRWSIEGRDTLFQPEGLERFTFGPGEESTDEEAEAATRFSAQGETVLDGHGQASINPEISVNPALPQPRQCNLLVEITDLGQATISERSQFVRQSSSFYLGLERPDEVVVAGNPLPIKLVAVTADGAPRAEATSARVVIERRDFHTVREQGAGGTLNYRTETRYVSAFDNTVAALPLTKKADRWEISASSTTEFTPSEVGSYRLRATSKDEAGHPVETTLNFSVTAQEPRRTDWDYRNEAQIDLVPDKDSYAPGEQANILVKTPINVAALVSVEQDRVRRAFLTKLEGNAPTVRVPVEATDAPNVFVSVLTVRGRAQSPRKIKTPDYRVGYARLNVVRPDSRLSVALESSDRAYRPGSEVTTTVLVKNSSGRPLADAEIALFAVDEGVLSLTGYKAPDPYSFFYSTRPLRVQTGLTLPNLFPEDQQAASFSNKGFLIGGGGEEMAPNTLRKNFLGTAFWKADLRTGADGRAQAHFPAPDNLTRFRLVAVVNAGADRFGNAESSFEVNKPLMLEPALPAFATVGDKLSARAVLRNSSTASGEAEVTLRLDDKTEPATPLVRRLTIAAGAAAAIDFPVEFKNPGTAHWIWSARLNAGATPLTDAVQSDLPVGFAAPILREILTDRTKARQSNLLANANPQFLEGSGRFQVSVANTRLLGLIQPVAYLLHNPDGCAEQTNSNKLPWIAAPQLRQAIPELAVPNDKASQAISLGISRLLEMQTESGGLGFWPHDRQPSFWASAYGVVGLSLAQRGGWPVPVATVNKVCEYLSGALRNSGDLQDNFELSERCLALYGLALAGRPENSYHEVLFNKRARLSAESRALLALAILESNGPATMIEELINPHGPMLAQGDVCFGSDERELAVRLLAWSQLRPHDQEVDTLVEELLRSQNQGRWANTQSNAWALLALTKYATTVETGEKRIAGSIEYNGNRHPFQLDEQTRAFAEDQAIVNSAPGASPIPLSLDNPQEGLLFTQVKMEARPPVGKQPRQDRGFSLQRSYQKLNDDGSLSKFDSLGVGDRVLVRLQLEVRKPAHFVAVDDALPAIFEAVNPEFKTQAMRGPAIGGGDWISDYRELRRDRALFFCNHLAPGSYTVSYLARVQAAGTVIAPPAKIEEMYHPERFGLSEAIEVKSTSLE
jgi:uncharacterized protein YfaS (alpha-2-macroglobulin family)